MTARSSTRFRVLCVKLGFRVLGVGLRAWDVGFGEKGSGPTDYRSGFWLLEQKLKSQGVLKSSDTLWGLCFSGV